MKKSRQILRLLNLELNDRFRITKYKNIFCKGYNENRDKHLLLILFRKLKIKYLNREKIIVSFYEEE